mmetsp:Transcript_28130/g.71965  ORF Transcript_28130/g.71965 Transcript_28130/m.71965 type:complete len:453 (-) Transcript_28130:1264-2622(-)
MAAWSERRRTLVFSRLTWRIAFCSVTCDSSASRRTASCSSSSWRCDGGASPSRYSMQQPCSSSTLRSMGIVAPASTASTASIDGTHWLAASLSSSLVDVRSPVAASSASPSSFCARLRPTWCHMRLASSGHVSIADCIAECERPSTTTDVHARAEAARGEPVSSDCSPMTTPEPRRATTALSPFSYSSMISTMPRATRKTDSVSPCGISPWRTTYSPLAYVSSLDACTSSAKASDESSCIQLTSRSIFSLEKSRGIRASCSLRICVSTCPTIAFACGSGSAPCASSACTFSRVALSISRAACRVLTVRHTSGSTSCRSMSDLRAPSAFSCSTSCSVVMSFWSCVQCSTSCSRCSCTVRKPKAMSCHICSRSLSSESTRLPSTGSRRSCCIQSGSWKPFVCPPAACSSDHLIQSTVCLSSSLWLSASARMSVADDPSVPWCCRCQMPALSDMW